MYIYSSLFLLYSMSWPATSQDYRTMVCSRQRQTILTYKGWKTHAKVWGRRPTNYKVKDLTILHFVLFLCALKHIFKKAICLTAFVYLVYGLLCSSFLGKYFWTVWLTCIRGTPPQPTPWRPAPPFDRAPPGFPSDSLSSVSNEIRAWAP